MRAVSDAFLRTLQGSHRIFSRARVVTTYQEGVNPTGIEIPIIEGNVRADSSSDIRTSLDLTTSGIGMWPATNGSLLAPYGNEIYAERGIDYGNGTVEVVSLGYFRINRTLQDDGPDGPIQLDCSDRMAGIIDARLVQPVQFSAGTTLQTVFETLVFDVYPQADIIFDFSAGSTTFATSHVAEEDRYGFLQDVARSHGKIMYWDYAGRLRIESPPDPAVPVWTVSSGRGGVLIQLSRSLDRQGVYNAVVATGETVGEAPPVRAVVYDMNTSSPTYWNGRFGHVPRFYYSSFIQTVTQATGAAKSILQQATGLPYSVNFTAVPNPALEPYDPVQIIGPDSVDIHVVDSLTIPLTHDAAMPATTRKLISFELGDVVN